MIRHARALPAPGSYGMAPGGAEEGEPRGETVESETRSALQAATEPQADFEVPRARAPRGDRSFHPAGPVQSRTGFLRRSALRQRPVALTAPVRIPATIDLRDRERP